MDEKPLDLAYRLATDPDSVSDADKLRSIADYIDATDRKLGYTGTQVQEFLRGLAERIGS